MRKRRYTEAQIVTILKELDAGRPAAELARKHGVHVNTLRLWRSKYGGLDVSDLSRLKELETENSQMERIIARQALELRAMSVRAVVHLVSRAEDGIASAAIGFMNKEITGRVRVANC